MLIKLLIILTLSCIAKEIQSQTLKEIKTNKKLIQETLKENKPEEEIKSSLNNFTLKSLQEFVKDYNLGYRKKTKEQLINKIVEKIEILKLSKKENQLTLKTSIIKQSPSQKENKISNKNSQKISQKITNKKRKRNTLIYYKAENILITDKKDKNGHKHILLFGKVKLKLYDKELEADSMKIKINKKNIAIEIVSEGSLKLKDQNDNYITGSKIILYPQINRSEIFGITLYKKPLYIYGKNGKQVAQDKYIIDKGYITTDRKKEVKHPHWQINYSKAWFYNKQFLFANNTNYKIGNTSIMYLPFFFKSQLETGIKTSLSYDKGMEWSLNNTFIYIPGKSIKKTKEIIKSKSDTSLKNYKSINKAFKLKLDYYQKLGFYFGGESIYNNKKVNIFSDFAFAIDRSARYNEVEDKKIENFFDQNDDGIEEETNTFRWKTKQIIKIKLLNNYILENQLDFNFNIQGEPFFQNQFENYREISFDLYRLSHLRRSDKYDNKTIRTRDDSSSTNDEDKINNINFKLNNKLFKNININIKVELDYILQKNEANPKANNPYKTNYYKYYKNIYSTPQINASYSNKFNILGQNSTITKTEQKEEKEKEEKKARELINILEPTDEENNQKLKDLKEKAEENLNIKQVEYISKDLSRNKKIKFTLPLIYTIDSNFEKEKTYNLNKENKIYSNINELKNSLKIELPFNLTYNFLELKVNITNKLNHLSHKTKTPTKEQIQTDSELSYTGWERKIALEINNYFFEDYKYLYLKTSTNINYKKKDRFDTIIQDPISGEFIKESNREESWSLSSSIEFFKSKLKLSFTNNIYISEYNKNQIAINKASKYSILKEQKGDINLELESKIIDSLYILNQLSFSQKDDEYKSNKLTLEYNITNWLNILWRFNINKLSHKIIWYKDFSEISNDYIKSEFKFNFNLGNYWNFILTVASSNQNLYRYTNISEEYGFTKKNIFNDLIKSFNFFKPSDRKDSLFKIKSLSLNIEHNLHSWTMNIGLELKLRSFINNNYYFEPRIYFTLYLNESSSFRYPKVNHTFKKS